MAHLVGVYYMLQLLTSYYCEANNRGNESGSQISFVS